jgi:hypothetical protein
VKIRVVALLAALAALTGCTPPLNVDPAPSAADPRCAAVMLGVPDVLGGLRMRPTDSQATAAWGKDYPIVMRCGVELPQPTTDPCFTIESGRYSADWVTRDVGDYRIAVSYGRDPAVEVVVPLVRADKAVSELLTTLTPAAALADKTGHSCVGPADAQALPSPSPSA